MPRTFLGLAAAFTVVFTAAFAPAEPPKPGIAATVNGDEIRLAQVDAFIKSKLAVIPV